MNKQVIVLFLSTLLFSCSNHDDTIVDDVMNNEESSDSDSNDNSDNDTISTTPKGIYVLSNGNSTGNIRDYDFVSGFTLRLNWGEFEPTQNNFDFTTIDVAIDKLQSLNQKLTIELLVFNTPQYVLDGASETWSFSSGSPVPWDTFGLEAWDNAAEALANHQVALADGTMVRLADHPTLESVDAPIMGLSGIRDTSGELVNLASYTREKFIDAISVSVHSMREAFPNKFGFIAAFKKDDADTVSHLDQEIVNRLMTEFNNPEQLSLGFFQELLSDVGPNPETMGLLLTMVANDTYIMFQALTSWTSPFTGANKVTSGNPATGIELGYTTYGAKYYELYISDIDNESLWEDLRAWSEILLSEE